MWSKLIGGCGLPLIFSWQVGTYDYEAFQIAFRFFLFRWYWSLIHLFVMILH